MQHRVIHDFILKGLYSLSLFMLIACNSNDGKSISLNKSTTDDSLKIKLIGKWGGFGEQTPVWDIRVDSIYYYDRATAYPYKLTNGDLVIDLPASKDILRRLSIIEDTMFYYLDNPPDFIISAYRFPK